MIFNGPTHRSSPCEKGIMLLHAWARNEPTIVALLPRLTRVELDDAMLNVNPTWRIYIAHVSECPHCSGCNPIELNAALADLALLN
jgi:hypothetical protein